MESPSNIWTRNARRVRYQQRKQFLNLIWDSIALVAIGFIFGVLFVAVPILAQGV